MCKILVMRGGGCSVCRSRLSQDGHGASTLDTVGRPVTPEVSRLLGTPYFAGEMLKSMAGIDRAHVPYKAQGPVLNDLMFGNLPDFLPHIQSGKLRAIGTTYLTRAPLAPGIPTIAEQGLPNVETDSWYGIVASSNMPVFAVTLMNGQINQALQEPLIRKNLAARRIEIIGGKPAAFEAHITREIAQYARIVNISNMKID